VFNVSMLHFTPVVKDGLRVVDSAGLLFKLVDRMDLLFDDPADILRPQYNQIPLWLQPVKPSPSYFRFDGGHRQPTLVHLIGDTQCVSW
jgi:hypothetical protein